MSNGNGNVNAKEQPPEHVTAEVVDEAAERPLPKFADFLDAASKVIGRASPKHGGAMGDLAAAARALDVDVEDVQRTGRALAGASKRAYKRVEPYAQAIGAKMKNAHGTGDRSALNNVVANQVARERERNGKG